MENMKLRLTPITDYNFRDYGVRISDTQREPDADSSEFRFWNKLGVLDHGGNSSISIVQTYGRNGLVEESLERHINTGEALLATEDIYIVIALSMKDDPEKPDLDTVKAFHIKKGEGVILQPGTWHHAPLTEAETANTFVVFYENTPDEDLLIYDLKLEFGCVFEIDL